MGTTLSVEAHRLEAPRRRRVMVVDDDPDLCAALAQRLEAEQDDVDCYRCGSEALDALRSGLRPDLIVLDLNMPNMDGWEFRVAQKREPAWADIPVVVISGDDSPQAKAIDAAALLHKPVDDSSFIATLRDVSAQAERRKAERQEAAQRQQFAREEELQRLVSLGALVGGIAHEINNPLAIVFGNLDLLQRQLIDFLNPHQPAGPFSVASAMRALERVRVGAERVADVVRITSMFASADLEGTESIDVHKLLESAIQVASNEIRHGAHLVRNYSEVPPVRANPARLGQVFLNLLLNAVYAIHDSGGRDHVIRVSTSSDEDSVVITVADSATKLDGSGAAGVFDPAAAAYTRGPRPRFGLAVSRELVQEMGGTITYAPEPQRGAAFQVTLPASERMSLPPPVPKPPARLAVDRPTVLIIDDEAELCELWGSILEEDYAVTAFTSPRAALAALRENDYDAIVCDVMMPELTGVELYDHATRGRPGLADRFIFITGGAFTERARLFLKQTGRPVLRKPCPPQELLGLVASVAVKGAAR
jgi:CheY-like chemotaxis protein